MDNILNDKIKKNLRWFLFQILSIQMFGLILVTGIFIYSEYETKSVMAKQIGKIVEGRIKNGDKRGALYVLSSAEFESFKAIGYFDKNGKRILTFPARLNPNYFQQREFIDKLLDSTVNISLFFDEKKTKKMGTLILTFNIFGQFLKGCIVWAIILILTIPLIRRYRSLIVDNIEKEMSVREALFAEKVSRQVRHDLAGAMQQIFDITEKKDGIERTQRKSLLSAISRIEKTLQDLPGSKAILGKVGKNKEREHNIAYILKSFYDQVTPILKEKYGVEVELKLGSINLFSKVQGNDFFRVIQNLVENAATANATNIKIELQDIDNKIKIIVSNNGDEIPQELRAKIFDNGFTFGKKDGTGEGLSFVKDKLISWSGSIDCTSNQKETCFIISLKKSVAPSYHPNEDKLINSNKLVLIDDDTNIHEKVHTLFSDKNILSFFKDYEFKTFLDGSENQGFFALVDYDLGKDSKYGVDIIKENNLFDKAYLLTANYDEETLIKLCEQLNIKLLPKNLVNFLYES